MIVEVERVVAHEADWIVPYFWTNGDSHETFETAAETDPTVSELTKLTEVAGSVLYQAEWISDIETVAYRMTRADATLLNAIRKDDR